jgi:hypothetical protein
MILRKIPIYSPRELDLMEEITQARKAMSKIHVRKLVLFEKAKQGREFSHVSLEKFNLLDGDLSVFQEKEREALADLGLIFLNHLLP